MGRKSKHNRLDVYMNGVLVGKLTRTPAGIIEFSYSGEWLDLPNAQSISCSMPLREEPFRDTRVNAYFDNLLPDNDSIRKRIAERVGADGKSAFDLLSHIGRDCVGALRFIPEGVTLKFSEKIEGEELKSREIATILKDLKTSPLGLVRNQEFRISLAGTQEKTALLRWKNKWYRPSGTTATTHILKPPIGELPNGIDMSQSVQNEWLCLKIAEHFGLPVAKAEIADFDGLDCLVIERFDRKWATDQKSLYRLPQEDVCQALSIHWSRKYETEGGPGIKTIMDFLNASDRRDEDREKFLRTQLVFFLLGAVDGHAKNFSVALRPTGFALTPLYDIMTIYPPLEARQLEIKSAKLAMAIGNNRHYRLREIKRDHWEQTAKKCGFPKADLDRLIDDLIKRADTLPDFAKGLGSSISRKLIATILQAVAKAMNRIK